MPYKCVHCSATYPDGDEALLKGCSSCNRKFFFYITKDKLEKMNAEGNSLEELSAQEKKQMEHDVREIAGISDEETPVFLDFESVTITKPGTYLIDVQKLFSKDKPRVYKLEDGKYIIDLSLKSKSGEK